LDSLDLGDGNVPSINTLEFWL